MHSMKWRGNDHIFFFCFRSFLSYVYGRNIMLVNKCTRYISAQRWVAAWVSHANNSLCCRSREVQGCSKKLLGLWFFFSDQEIGLHSMSFGLMEWQRRHLIQWTFDPASQLCLVAMEQSHVSDFIILFDLSFLSVLNFLMHQVLEGFTLLRINQDPRLHYTSLHYIQKCIEKVIYFIRDPFCKFQLPGFFMLS